MIDKITTVRVLNIFAGLISILMILSVGFSEAGVTNIRISEKAETENDEILLGDVSNITGEDKEFIQELKTIIIGNAPLPGTCRKINEDQILIRLKQNGIDLSSVNLFFPKTAEVLRRTVKIRQNELEMIVLNFLEKTLPWNKNSVRISNIKAANEVLLPTGKITYTVVPPRDAKFLGTIPLSVNFSVNGQFERKAWVTVSIEVLTDVIVSKRPLGRYKLITDDDIQMKRMDLAELPSNVITSREEVLGKRTTRAIQSNVIFRADHVEFPPLVKRGDVVLIIAESTGLKVTTLGKIKERGRKGDLVRVVNLDSKKGIYARVLDSESVKVDF